MRDANGVMAEVQRYTDTPMMVILQELKAAIEVASAGDRISFEVLNPDVEPLAYAGSLVTCDGVAYRHRGYKAWTDCAEALGCRMLTPQQGSEYTVVICFEKLQLSDSFHQSAVTDVTEKYGSDSRFFGIQKLEEPAFLAAYLQALEDLGIHGKRRILNLGVNRGDEFEAIREMVGREAFAQMECVGVDHCTSAIEQANSAFPESNVTFVEADINALDALELGRFDLIISIGTLQSPGIDLKETFMALVQRYLAVGGAMLLGFPNCRWMDGEMIYGAKAPNYERSEQSLLYKDVYWCKKYLQQKKFRVTLRGKPYLFLCGMRIGNLKVIER